jgi:hypothetical protein
LIPAINPMAKPTAIIAMKPCAAIVMLGDLAKVLDHFSRHATAQSSSATSSASSECCASLVRNAGGIAALS